MEGSRTPSSLNFFGGESGGWRREPPDEKVQAVRRGSGSPATTAVAVGDLWVEMNRGDEERRDVLRGVDLKVEKGERLALMGRNGAGKSTFLRTLAGLNDAVRGKFDAPGGIALLSPEPQ